MLRPDSPNVSQAAAAATSGRRAAAAAAAGTGSMFTLTTRRTATEARPVSGPGRTLLSGSARASSQPHQGAI